MRFSSRQQRGQAFVEYSIINFLLMIALIMGCVVRMIPVPLGAPINVIDLFMQAYQTYYDSFYFVLNSPFP